MSPGFALSIFTSVGTGSFVPGLAGTTIAERIGQLAVLLLGEPFVIRNVSDTLERGRLLNLALGELTDAALAVAAANTVAVLDTEDGFIALDANDALLDEISLIKSTGNAAPSPDSRLTANFTGLTTLTDDISELSLQLDDESDRIVRVVRNRINASEGRIIDSTQAAVDGAESRILSTVSQVPSLVATGIEQSTGTTNALIQALDTDISTRLDDIQSNNDGIVDSILDGIFGLFGGVTEVLVHMDETFFRFFGDVFSRIEAVLVGLGLDIGSTVERVINRAIIAIGEIIPHLDILAEEIREHRDQVIRVIGEVIGPILTGIPKETIDEAERRINEGVEGTDRWMDEADPVFRQIEDVLTISRVDCRTLFAETLPQTPALRMVVLTLVAMAVAVMVPAQIASARAQVCLQEWSRENPWKILPPPDAVKAFYRGRWSPEKARETIQRDGFSAADAETVIELLRQLPEESVALSMWLRGILDDAELDRALHGIGWSPEWIVRWKEAAFFIPPVADLISMAVREAFSPEVAERFGQFEDFPPDFARWGAAQGVSEEWARRYWAAHWALPSVQMGFEMLHRGVISQDELNLLLRAQDVMPFWREKLTQISFTPFTRVDIRRMHKVGVLSEDEVERAYRDIGYDEEKARKLTDFVLRLNETEEEFALADTSELTRSNIIGFFRDGILDRTTAEALLIEGGMSLLSAELFLLSAEMKEESEDRRDAIDIVLRQFDAGVIDFDAAQSALDRLGLETVERDKAGLKLVRRQQRNQKVPSRAEAERMFKLGIIEQADYAEVLLRAGYPPFWRDAFIALAGGEAA